ncbi:MAG: N-acetyl-gamma-glutamyl-phosphate reductase, partial [Alphaproteobacteria bacterium]
VGVIGASGYTGGELLRLLAGHARVEVTVLTGERRAGSPVAAVLPHLRGLQLPELARLEQADWDRVDAVYCCLPHGTTQEVIAGLPGHLKVVDLSADFRLADPALYETWYGHPHLAPELQREAVYGLTEIARDRIAGARLVANPGCYPTAALIPLVPLVEAGLVAAEDIIIDAKSGVSGAGRTANEANLYAEVGEGAHAYGIAAHRHAPEIDQGLSAAAGQPVVVTFTPHLVPMNRGLLATIYVELAGASDADDLRHELARRYEGEPFVRILPPGEAPATRHVRGSNLCLIAVFADRLPGRAIVLSAIDNLVKGASGQAIQNMNLMCGLEESAGLTQPPFFP